MAETPFNERGFASNPCEAGVWPVRMANVEKVETEKAMLMMMSSGRLMTSS